MAQPTKDPDGSLLVVVLDTNPGQKLFREDSSVLLRCLEAVMSFCNAYLALSSRNRLAVVASHLTSCEFLYPREQSGGTRNQDGKYELFNSVNKSMEQSIKEMFSRDLEGGAAGDSTLGGALSMALCYINRVVKDNENKLKLTPRMLVITSAGDSGSQYMTFMNAFFTAQKHCVIVDSCAISKDSGLLQQGCDITGGIYLKISQIEGLLQYLLWVFLPDVSTRTMLALPAPTKLDYRAACFCHRNLIEIGYVCSVCLSIFCSFSPICSTCHSVYKLPSMIPALAKKKKAS